MSFHPVAGSSYGLDADPSIASEPWIIPEGYVQSVVSEEAGSAVRPDPDAPQAQAGLLYELKSTRMIRV